MVYIILTIIAIIILIFIIVSLIDSNRISVSHYDIESVKILRNKKIVFISDLHNKRFPKNNAVLWDKLKEINPDCIFVGGDILTAYPKKDINYALDFINELKSYGPLFYAMGNHEYRLRLYKETYGDMYDKYEEGLKRIGIDFIDNDKVEFDDFVLYGLSVEREYYKRFTPVKMDDEYIQTLIGGPSESKFNIVLAHNPDYFKNYDLWGADLTLAGHVHGGVMRLPFGYGAVSPRCVLFPKYSKGLYSGKNGRMIVSAGLGMHTIPLRIFNPADMVVIDLKGLKKS